MRWRTVVISKRAKLDMKTGYLVVRSEEETHKINLDDISVLSLTETREKWYCLKIIYRWICVKPQICSLNLYRLQLIRRNLSQNYMLY